MNRIMKTLGLFALILSLTGCLFGGGYVRLRGSSEIHDDDCPLVRAAPDEGVVDAGWGDGPPCYRCLREEAVEWARDQD